jgi:hypothetical protein
MSMAFPIAQFVKVPRLDALDQTKVYEQMLARITADAFAGGLSGLITHIERGIRQIQRARNLTAQWEAQRQTGPELLSASAEASPRLVPLDQDVDRCAARLYRKMEQDIESFGRTSAEGRAALRILHAAFPDGLGAHTRDTHAHQDVKNRETIAALHDELYASDIAMLRVQPIIDELEVAVNEFHEAYEAVQRAKSEILPYSAVEEAEAARHLHLLETFALALSLSIDQDALRDNLLGPLSQTLETRRRAIREARATALGGEDAEDTDEV